MLCILYASNAGACTQLMCVLRRPLTAASNLFDSYVYAICAVRVGPLFLSLRCTKFLFPTHTHAHTHTTGYDSLISCYDAD